MPSAGDIGGTRQKTLPLGADTPVSIGYWIRYGVLSLMVPWGHLSEHVCVSLRVFMAQGVCGGELGYLWQVPSGWDLGLPVHPKAGVTQ
jgi:hypothetical protein